MISGWGVSGANTPDLARPAAGRPGLGKAAQRAAPVPANGIAWIYGAGCIQYVFARDPKLDVNDKPDDHRERLLSSRLMIRPSGLSRFAARAAGS